MNSRIETLQVLNTAMWRELVRGATERDHDWHVLTLATLDGQRASARTVVLREVTPEAQTLVFYSDARAAKIGQMRFQPQGCLVAWSRQLGWQLRLEVTLEVAVQGLDVSSRWARVKLSPSAQDYLAALPPGTPVDRYVPERGSREHFAVVTAQVTAIDWLELHTDGHRRARFDSEGARWLAP
ncbi:MAG: pyridoxamine 5'-phosphate oxidase family protein [Rubrivivax sp.]|nr:pyridoxamine 5'-phosphate oxidase family protein [Rubrivivax sp.]